MFAKFFNITKTPDLIKVTIFGLRLKFKRGVNFSKLNMFMQHNISKRTILIVELNNCHFETITGFSYYLIKLGFSVDILTRFYSNHAFDALNFGNALKIFELNAATFKKAIKGFDFSRYERILFNSKRIYKRIYFKQKEDGIDVAEYFRLVPSGAKENIYVQHHIDKFNDFWQPHQIVLANPAKLKDLTKCVVNPHYYGDFKIKTFKNQSLINFISVGNITKSRRNTSLVIDAAKALLNWGYTNFKITIIGRGVVDIDPSLKRYFKILGRVDYQTMFCAVNDADFMLPLLDPAIEAHQRYLRAGTSGTFMLAYGFLKPCVIHQTFADSASFNQDNSVIYTENEKLASAMLECIKMSPKTYQTKQQALKDLAATLEANSINNLARMLSDW